jgi:flagellar basal body rod protein FlgF
MRKILFFYLLLASPVLGADKLEIKLPSGHVITLTSDTKISMEIKTDGKEVTYNINQSSEKVKLSELELQKKKTDSAHELRAREFERDFEKFKREKNVNEFGGNRKSDKK